MNHHDQRRYPRPYRRTAQVIPLHPPGPWHSIGYSLLTIACAVLIATMLVIALRSGNDVMTTVARHGPWW